MSAGGRPTTVGEVGEFALIDLLAARLPAGRDVAIGIGDDAAALEPTIGDLLLVTTDGQVEGVHFRRDATPPDALGHRALATNLSDVAAMGGRPRWATVALTLPHDLPLAWIEQLYGGLADLARAHDVGVVGGNVARSLGGVVIDVTVLGEVRPNRRLTRSGAQPGDVVIVTGRPGESAGGLELILHPELRAGLAEADALALLEAHWRPIPRVAAGQLLAASGAVTAAIDVSDGLAADLGHVLRASRVGATLEQAALPIGSALEALERAGGPPARGLVLAGGEAYELLFTCRPDAADAIVASLATIALPGHRIGTIDAEPGLRLRGPGGLSQAPGGGHDHFSTRAG